MNIKLYRQWVITDRNGKVIRRTRKRLSDSYVLAFIDILQVQMETVAHTIKDIGNVDRSVGAVSTNFSFSVATNEEDAGLVVGTGTNAIALADYALQTRIAHGTGAGELQYGVGTENNPVTDGTTRKFTVTRTFTNGSGGTVTVNETGIYVKGASTPFFFCIARDLEDPGQAIADAATGTLTYTISTTV